MLSSKASATAAAPKILLPFLYQTRTIASLDWPRRPRHLTRNRSVLPSPRRRFAEHKQSEDDPSSSPVDGHASDHSAETDPSSRPLFRKMLMDGAENWIPKKRREPFVRKIPHGAQVSPQIEHEENRAKRMTESSSDIPWDVDPRERKSVPRGAPHRAQIDEWQEADALDFDDNSGESSARGWGKDTDSVPFESPDNQPKKGSTLTPTEREAFQNIFSDIMSRSKASEKKPEAESPKFFDVQASPASGRRPDARENAQSIMSQSVEIDVRRKGREIARKMRQGLNFQTRDGRQMEEKMRGAVEMYPPALRMAAAKALGLVASRSAPSDDDEVLPTTLDADEKQRLEQANRERERVEALMVNAKTDFELWEIMEKEVFVLPEKMGFDESASTTKKKGKRAKKAVRDADEEDKASAAETKSEEKLVLYGPLYPSYLLLGLRNLDRSFAEPSPLVLSVLPRIKSHGLTSLVLGASTALYNELIRIYWIRYDDLKSCLTLLKEMEQIGLAFDGETRSIVLDIIAMQKSLQSGSAGEALQALWSLPSHNSNYFVQVLAKIEAALDERAEELERNLEIS